MLFDLNNLDEAVWSSYALFPIQSTFLELFLYSKSNLNITVLLDIFLQFENLTFNIVLGN